MAIIIPSKNIYNKQNSPLVKNQIKKAEINAADISILNEENVSVHNTSVADFADVADYVDKDISTVRYSHATGLGSPQYLYSGTVAYAKYDCYKKITKTLSLNRAIKDNKYISAITEYKYAGDGNSKNNLTYTIYGKKKKGVTSATWQTDLNSSDLSVVQGDIIYSEPTEISEADEIIQLPEKIIAKYEGSTPTGVNAEVNLVFKENEDLLVYSENKNKFEIGIEIPVGIRTTTLSGFVAQTLESGTNLPIELQGTYELYEPTRVEISIFGDMLSLDISESNLVYGETSSSSNFVLSDNELLQVTNSYLGENALNKLSQSVFAQYQNGKETLELTCSISDYYEKGNESPVISITDAQKRMLFENGDIIEPYLMNELGQDVPISQKADGTAMQFKIVGTKRIFDGACWQKLICQEFVE